MIDFNFLKWEKKILFQFPLIGGKLEKKISGLVEKKA
jgi:hypothetical protein